MQVGDKVRIKVNYFSLKILGIVEDINGSQITVKFNVPIKGRTQDTVHHSKVFTEQGKPAGKASKTMMFELDKIKERLTKLAR